MFFQQKNVSLPYNRKQSDMKHIKLVLFSSALHDNTSVISSREPLFEGLRSIADLEIIYPSTLVTRPSALESQLDGTRSNDSSSLLAQSDSQTKTVCFIGTGGTEEIFRNFLNIIPQPVILLSDGFHNSLAAALEISTYLGQNNIERKLYNAPLDYSQDFFKSLDESLFGENDASIGLTTASAPVPELPKSARGTFAKARIGLVGGASSWLISSDIDREKVTAQYGSTFVDIDLQELEKEFNATKADSPEVQQIATRMERFLSGGRTKEDLMEASRMYLALKKICTKYSLSAVTVKCFGLLSSCGTTACLALALLNDEGIVAGCEGDIPTVWTMLYAKIVYGQASFMANPSSSNRSERTIDFAHCTIPLSMVHGYRLPTHFESSIGIGIAGSVPSGRYRIIKISGAQLDRFFTLEGEIIMNTNVPQRCRTQVRFRFASEADFDTFLSESKGNHIVLIPA